MKLSEKLVLLRREKGLTQSELADAMELSRQTVSRWEVGSSLPAPENLARLSRFYAVPADYLLNEKAERAEGGERAPEEAAEEKPGTAPGAAKKVLLKRLAIVLILLALAAAAGGYIYWKLEVAPVPLYDLPGGKVDTEAKVEFELEW